LLIVMPASHSIAPVGSSVAPVRELVAPAGELVTPVGHSMASAGQSGARLRGAPSGGGGPGGAGVLVPPLDPGVTLGPLLALAGRGRVGGQDGAAGGGAQLPGGLGRGVIENLLLDGRRMVTAEAGDLVGDDGGLEAVDPPGGQRSTGGGQAT
jgi:hypothetical protein